MSKKSKLKYYIPGAIALIFGIAAFCMMFLPAITFTAGNTTTDGYTGAQLAFGYKETYAGQEVTILNFNFVALLAFLLPLAGGVIALITKNGFISKILSTACFVAGAVLLFCIVSYSSMGNVKLEDDGILGSIVNGFLDELYTAIDETKGLGIGAIIGGVLSIEGAAVCFFKGTIAKLVK